MNAVALLALLNALPAASGKHANSSAAHASSTPTDASAAVAWRAVLSGRSSVVAKAAPAPAPSADPLAEAVARAVASGTAFSAVVDTAASALGSAVAASVDGSVDPAPVVAAVKAALDPPDPGGSPPTGTLDERVRTLVARLRNVADAAARVSETTTGQQNRFPGNDLDAATAAKANPAPTTTGTSDAAASEPLADRLLTVVRTALAAQTAAAKNAPVASSAGTTYLDVRSHAANVSAPVAAALLGSYVDAVSRTVPASAAAPASVTIAVPLPSGAVPVRATVTVDDAGAHATLAVADTATRDAVAARQASVVSELHRAGIDVADVTVVIDPAIASSAPAVAPRAAIAPAPAALRLAVANADAAAAKPQVLTASAYRAPAPTATAATVPATPATATTTTATAAPAGARALPVVESVTVPVAERAPIVAQTAAVAPSALVVSAPAGEKAASVPVTIAVGDDAIAPAATSLPTVSVAPLPTATPAATTATATTAAATALSPTVLDVATLAATSAPAVLAPPRDAVTLALTQAVAQAVARLDTGLPSAQQTATGDQAERDAHEQRHAGTQAALPEAPVAPLAAPQAAPPAAPAPAVDPYAIVDQLADAVVRTASGHAQTATELRVRLSPENLGELNVTVRVDGSSVTAQVTTHDAATHAVLASSGDGLAKTLAAAGLRLDGFTVGLAGGAANDFGRGSAQPQQERGRGRKTSFGTDADDVDPTSAVETAVPLVQRPGTLDELV